MAEKLKDERAPFRKIEESEAEPLQMPSKKRVQKKISGELLIYFWRFFFTFLCGPYTEILTFCFKRFTQNVSTKSWFHCFWKLVLTTKKVPSISLIKMAQENCDEV